MMISLFSLFCLSLTLAVFSRLVYKLWLGPIHMQQKLQSQGLKGPSYKLLHGNTKEIISMRKEAIKAPCDLGQHDMFPRILPHLNTWMKLYGKNFLIWIGNQPQIVVTEPELVREILTDKEGVYRKIKPISYAKKLLGDGLVVAEGEKWSKLRKLANHAFHGESLKDMVSAMVESVDTMLERWRYHEGKEIEVSKEFKLLTSDVISRTAFGSSYVEGKNIFDMMMKLGVLIAKNTFKIRLFGLKKIWRSKDDIESDKIEQSLHDSILSLVKKREDKVKAGESDNFGNDFLGSLLKVHHDIDPKSRISVDDIVDECKVFYIAGHETTSTLLSWTVFLLSIFTEWQEKARDEVVQVFGQEKPTAEGIARLKILTMIVYEALRLYSPVLSITRRVHRNIKLGKYEIPANVQVNVPTLALHRNPEIWGKDAHMFKPERFAEGLANAANRNSMAFLPFAAGPRSCVGNNFAVNEAKMTLSMILQRYRLALSPNYIHAPYQFLTVQPQHGVQIILHLL
ncbi:cytochrome P450 CYP749A22-like isoform X1 [Sesamum indicum]|uniref:Cytochrome P450 CYP749A22-like isoform X1 n=1 Tax=Sesamum indicum TaxID=4182 RepID=A0A6I9UIX0_SESIN|nr:cytochrome P450 CYP749A22-like isoform X1 [Sesamum indicum]